MEVVVGTYDEILLGYKIVKVAESYQFEQSFTDHSHTGCVKTVAISKKGILASGSTDESIHLFNLKKRTELGSLVHHSGTVTSLAFFQGKHMFSTSEDGTIGIWKFFTWECLKTLRGHKSPVNHISIHPSGKLALTVGRDKKLRTWNLVTGKSAYITSIKQEASLVVWSPDGEHYAVVFPDRIDVYATETARVQCSVKSTQRVNDISFVSNTVMVYGGEGGQVSFYDIDSKKLVHSINTETNRIRAIAIVAAPANEDDKKHGGRKWLFTASSDGHIKIYQIQTEKGKVDSQHVISHNTTFRLTCMAVSVLTESRKVAEQDTSAPEEKRTNETSRKRTSIDKAETEPESQDSGVGVSKGDSEDSESEELKEKKKDKSKKSLSGKKKLKKKSEHLEQKEASVKLKRKVEFKGSPPKKKKIKT